MNTKLLLMAVAVAALGSCTTLYKSGQTPDDVYFSPVRPAGGYVEDNRETQRDQANSYTSEYRSIRMGIYDPRWRYLDYSYGSDMYLNDYSYTPYSFGFNYGYYYNPFFWPYPVYGSGFISPAAPKNTTPRAANLAGYHPLYNNSALTSTRSGLTPTRPYNYSNSNSNRGSAVGNAMRQILAPSNNNSSINSNNGNSNNNTRSYTPSTSSSSSSSGSSSSGGGSISRPPRH